MPGQGGKPPDFPLEVYADVRRYLELTFLIGERELEILL